MSFGVTYIWNISKIKSLGCSRYFHLVAFSERVPSQKMKIFVVMVDNNEKNARINMLVYALKTLGQLNKVKNAFIFNYMFSFGFDYFE